MLFFLHLTSAESFQKVQFMSQCPLCLNGLEREAGKLNP